jgi:DNA repair exonuclease SbcCD ATPase subunit
MKIQLQELVIVNFMSIGEEPIRIVFDDKVYIVTGFNYDKNSRNGVGKTTLADALKYLFYGTTTREKHKQSEIVNRTTRQGCLVTGKLKVGDDIVEIQRGLKPKILSLIVNGTEDKTRTSDDTKKDIINLIGYDEEIFTQEVILSLQNATSIFQKSPTKKTYFIEQIFNLKGFDEHFDYAKMGVRDASKKLEIIGEKRTMAENNLQSFKTLSEEKQKQKQKQLEELTNQITEYERKITESKKRLEEIDLPNYDGLLAKGEASLVKAERDRDAIHNKISELKVEHQSIKNHISEQERKIADEKDKLDKLISRKNSLEETRMELTDAVCPEIAKIEFYKSQEFDDSAILSLKDSIKKEKENLVLAQKYTGKCPLCEQAVTDKKHIEKETTRINGIISQLEDRLKEEEDKLSKKREEHKNLIAETTKKKEEWEATQKQKIDIVATELISMVNDIGIQKKITDEMRKDRNEKIKKIQKHATEIVEEAKPLKETGLEAQTKVDTIKEKLNKLKTKITEVQKHIQEKEQLEKDIKNTEETISNKKNEIEILQRPDNSFDEHLSNLTNEVKTQEKEYAVAYEDLEVWNAVKKFFSPDGLKALLINQSIQLFNEQLNYYLAKLNAPVTCEFNSLFEETIITEKGDEVTFASLSGGERTRLEIATIFAFRDLRRSFADRHINFAFFDEVFDSTLDAQGVTLVTEILKEQCEQFQETLFVITHRQENESLDSVETIYLEKRDEITRRIC